MPFIVVEAKNTEKSWIEPIPITWLSYDKNFASFPKSDKDLNRFARKQVEPENDWPKFIVIIKSIVFATYEAALEKCKAYVDHHTDTDANLESVENQSQQKRKIKPTQNFMQEQAKCMTLTSTFGFPQGQGESKKKNPRTKKPRVDCDDTSSDSDASDSDGISAMVSSFSLPKPSNGEKVAISKEVSTMPEIIECQLQGSLAQNCLNQQLSIASSNSSQQTPRQITSGSKVKEVIPTNSFESMLLHKVNSNAQKLNEVLRLLHVLIDQPANQQVPMPTENLHIQLPLNSIEELVTLNDLLKSESNRCEFLKQVPHNLHSELSSRVSLLMERMFSDSLALQLNWKGCGKEKDGQKKQGLRNFTYVYTVIVQYFGSSADLAMPKIKKWLSNAAARVSKKGSN